MFSMLLQSEHSSVHRKTVMMTALYKYWLIYTIVYYIYAVHSAQLKGTFNNTIYQELSDNIDGYQLHDLQNADSLLLEKVENQGTSSVSITNFQHLWDLEIYSISLRTMPKLENLPNLHLLNFVGNGLKFIPRSAFNGLLNLIVINIQYNEIRSIANLAFPSTLEILILRCNKLTFFTDAWFQKPESVKTLDLSGNQIEELQESEFALFTKLYSLNLFNNRISTIGDAALGYHSPMQLHLGYNNLSHISANMFAKNITMELFRIDYNRLCYLSDDLLKKLDIKQITIDGNPWQCPCLRKLEKWTPRIHILKMKHKLYSDSIPVCVVATSFSDVCVPAGENELEQLYVDSIPTRPVNMCGIANDLRYYNSTLWAALKQEKRKKT